MNATASPPSVEPPFRYIGGDASVDFVNTVTWTTAGLVHERLTGYDSLTRWAEGAGLLSHAEAEGLRRCVEADPVAAEAACEAARRLRGLLQRVYASIARRDEDPEAWDELNRELAAVLPRRRLGRRSRTAGRAPVAEWCWSGDDDLDSIRGSVLWAAARLLTSEDAWRLEICDGPDCGWMYVDRSRNRLRRWCEMETCGTEAKTRRRRERRQRRRSAATRIPRLD